MQPEVGGNEENNVQYSMGIYRSRIRQYAPSTARPNQPNVQATKWTKVTINNYEMNSVASSDDENHIDNYPEVNKQTDMRKPELVTAMKFSNSKVFRKVLREYVVNETPLTAKTCFLGRELNSLFVLWPIN